MRPVKEYFGKCKQGLRRLVGISVKCVCGLVLDSVLAKLIKTYQVVIFKVN